MHGKWDNCRMPFPQRARHARRRARRLPMHVSPTALAIGGLVGLFALASVLAVHVMNVPAHLRQEGASDPTPGQTRQPLAAAHARSSKPRAARAEPRRSPTPTPTTPSPQRAVPTSPPAPAPTTSSPRPSPRPSPSSSSHRPIPLPTLNRPPPY